MACTYDPTTDRGRVRLLIGDTDCAGTYHFEDAEIDAFLAMTASGGINDVFMAAAAALRAWAAELVRDALMIKTLTFQRDTRQRAREMIAWAESLEAKAEAVPASEVAEIAQTDWEARRIIFNRSLREDG